eukprot:TRINITY_DN4792_c0_g1_i2.p4 TRINITY_DN4792_c0_g1~~TRINITY_DN4792_c0_g1_i2.p4  ORF type:complete len:128 (+),score=39.20 TRINITY_DN4792_c0_g1_i2:1184-1567(+)
MLAQWEENQRNVLAQQRADREDRLAKLESEMPDVKAIMEDPTCLPPASLAVLEELHKTGFPTTTTARRSTWGVHAVFRRTERLFPKTTFARDDTRGARYDAGAEHPEWRDEYESFEPKYKRHKGPWV